MRSAVVVAVLLAVAAVAIRFTAARPANVAHIISAHRVADAALTSDTGRTVRLDATQRAAVLVLGYTRCADACPVALAKVTTAARALHPAMRPAVFFLTTDPAYDTPPVLHRYLATWNGEITGITGERGALRRVTASLGAATPARSADHDTRLFLIDASGDIIDDIPPDIATGELRRLLASALRESR